MSQPPLLLDWPRDWCGRWRMSFGGLRWVSVWRALPGTFHPLFVVWLHMEGAWVPESLRGWEARRRHSCKIRLWDFEASAPAAGVNHPKEDSSTPLRVVEKN